MLSLRPRLEWLYSNTGVFCLHLYFTRHCTISGWKQNDRRGLYFLHPYLKTKRRSKQSLKNWLPTLSVQFYDTYIRNVEKIPCDITIHVSNISCDKNASYIISFEYYKLWYSRRALYHRSIKFSTDLKASSRSCRFPCRQQHLQRRKLLFCLGNRNEKILVNRPKVRWYVF